MKWYRITGSGSVIETVNGPSADEDCDSTRMVVYQYRECPTYYPSIRQAIVGWATEHQVGDTAESRAARIQDSAKLLAEHS